MRNAILLVGLVAAFGIRCASSALTGVSSAACSPAPEVVGSWKSYRTSTLGPAWMSITFNCDCTARVVSQLLFMRYTEEVRYRIENGDVVFTREHSETRWPFSLEPGALVVREAADESHRYTRTGAAPSCSASPQAR